MAQFQGISGGTLNVAVISAGDYFFPRLLVEFARRHPGVTLNLTVHNREDLLAQLADNLTDLAIMVRPPAELRRRRTTVRAAPVRDRRRADHPLAGAKRHLARALMREPFVVREKGSDTWNSMEDGFGAHLRDLHIAMEIKQHRDDQAGRDRRHGHRLPVRAHDQPGAASRQPGGARRARASR